MEINIETESMDKLKSIAYDILVSIQNLQAQLNAINQEIVKRSNKEIKEDKKENE